MKRTKRLLCFFLVVGVLSGLQARPALAASHIPAWEHVRRQMDCNGQTIEIDAVTDTNLPDTVCGHKASQYMMSEEALRAFVSAAAPEHADMPRVTVDNPDALPYEWHLWDESAKVLASCQGGLFFERYGQAYTRHAFAQHCTEPIETEKVLSLKGLGYADALKLMEPVLKSTGLTLGDPMSVTVYDSNSLTAERNAEDESYELEYPVYFMGARLHTEGGLCLEDESKAYTTLKVLLRTDGKILDLRVDSIMDKPVAVDRELAPMPLDAILDVYARYLSETI